MINYSLVLFGDIWNKNKSSPRIRKCKKYSFYYSGIKNKKTWMCVKVEHTEILYTFHCSSENAALDRIHHRFYSRINWCKISEQSVWMRTLNLLCTGWFSVISTLGRRWFWFSLFQSALWNELKSLWGIISLRFSAVRGMKAASSKSPVWCSPCSRPPAVVWAERLRSPAERWPSRSRSSCSPETPSCAGTVADVKRDENLTYIVCTYSDINT